MSNKGALALLAEYSGDSDEDDQIPGARVSTKRLHHSNEFEENCAKKRAGRLPVPEQFREKEIKNEYIEDPIEHQGRIRSFAHERGNWATYIFIPYETHVGIKELIDYIIRLVSPSFEVFGISDCHISLTRTVILRHHWIEGFISSVKSSLCGFRKFMLLFGDLQVYCNEEKTRTFIGIQARTGFDTLSEIVKTLDKCLFEFSLPTFYEDYNFHISIAWALGDRRNELENYISLFNEKLVQLIQDHPQEEWHIFVQYLLCKTGNKIYQFNLQ